MATVVVFLGLHGYLGDFGKFGDFSYGVYIAHFPIIQCFVQLRIFSNEPWLFLAALVVVTLIVSIALWHFVQKRFLMRSSHYLRVTGGA